MTTEECIPEHQSERYSSLTYIGQGAFATVYKATDVKKNTEVAIKVFQMDSSYYKLTYRELCALRHVKSHYLLRLEDVYLTKNEGKMKRLYLVLPLMDHDLDSILHKDDMVFTFDGIIKIMYQMLKGLQYLSEAGIIHRDLKPSNVGINNDHGIRIMDFGLAREKDDYMTKTVTSKYYRAIEVLCGLPYTAAIDIWSAGCIFVEIITKKLLFKGQKDFDQIKAIIKITGIPDGKIQQTLEHFREIAPKENQLRNHIKKDIRKFIYTNDDRIDTRKAAENVIDLICSMLELTYEKRPTPIMALQSNLFKQFEYLIKDYPDDIKAEPFTCEYINDSYDVLQGKLEKKAIECALKT